MDWTHSASFAAPMRIARGPPQQASLSRQAIWWRRGGDPAFISLARTVHLNRSARTASSPDERSDIRESAAIWAIIAVRQRTRVSASDHRGVIKTLRAIEQPGTSARRRRDRDLGNSQPCSGLPNQQISASGAPAVATRRECAAQDWPPVPPCGHCDCRVEAFASPRYFSTD